jgi:hypothetical protein
MTCPKIHMHAHFERFGVEIMPMQNPMVDAPLNSLIDSTVSLKVKTMEG